MSRQNRFERLAQERRAAERASIREIPSAPFAKLDVTKPAFAHLDRRYRRHDSVVTCSSRVRELWRGKD